MLVLAPAAVETGSALTLNAPPPKLAPWQVLGFGAAAGAETGLTVPVRAPSRPAMLSVRIPELPQASFKRYAATGIAAPPLAAPTVTTTAAVVAVAPLLSVALAVSV